MRNVIWIVATVGGAVAVLGLALWNRPTPDASLHARIAALEVEIAALRKDLERAKDLERQAGAISGIESADLSSWLDEVVDLRAEIEQLRDASRGVVSRSQVRASASAEASRPDEHAPAVLVRELDDRLRIEAGGEEARAWEDDLRARIGPILPRGAELRQLSCRISLCRVELSYPDQASYVAFIDEHLDGDEDSLWPGATFLHVDSEEDGPVVVSAYLALELQ